jgi:hypothetical protein
MDVKMDSGCMPVSKDGSVSILPISSVETALAMGRVPLTLTAVEQLTVMDELWCAESSWTTGARSLAHTVFTCWYTHRPSLIINTMPILYAHIIATLRCIDTIRSVVQSADVYEEEDIQLSTMGFSLCELISHDDAQKLLLDQERLLEIRSLRARGKHSDSKGEQKDDESILAVPLQSDPAQEAAICDAFLARLRFRKVLLIPTK